MIKKLKYPVFNAIFWVVYFLYEWLGHGAVADEYQRYLLNSVVVVSTAFLASYLSVNVLFIRFYLRHRQKHFYLGFVVVALVFVLIRRGFNYYYVYPQYYPGIHETMPFLFPPKLIIEFVNLYLVVSLYAMVYFMRSWYEQQQRIQSLEKEKISSELKLLKSQVHPHFIFNTLNNIYSVTVKKSPETAHLLLKLSSFLDYNLYDSKSDQVSLTTELTYIENYIALQKLRYGDKLDVSFNTYNDIEDVSISPLLLLPLVENAFKHGVAASISSSWIRIDIYRQYGSFTIKIENSKESTADKPADKSSGLGLQNVRKRLALLYPHLHELKIMEEENTYLVSLKITMENDQVLDSR